jgi:predicted hydrocarbon binding protein
MKRKDFLKACLVGVSSCAACGLMAPDLAAGVGAEGDASTLDAIRLRYATLVALIARHVPEQTQRQIFRDLGRECARQFKGMTYEKYRGDLAGFLAAARGRDGWMASAEHDERAGVITVVDRATTCSCPLVKQGLTPGAQCECTLGWQEETYSRILGRPVRASLGESILRGSTRCVFRIELATSADDTPGDGGFPAEAVRRAGGTRQADRGADSGGGAQVRP